MINSNTINRDSSQKREQKVRINREIEIIKSSRGAFEWTLFAVNTILIILQILILVFCSYDKPNAFVDIKIASRIYETGKISDYSLMMIVWGYLGRLLHIHPMTLIFSISPIIMLPIYYRIYVLLGRRLFGENRRENLLFIFFICIMHIFGYQSGYAVRITLLMGWFTTQSVIIHGILPYLLYLLLGKNIGIMKENINENSGENENKNARIDCNINTDNNIKSEGAGQYGTGPDGIASTADEIDEEDWEEMDMKKHPIINSRNIAIALLLCMVLMVTAIFILNRKINSLHAATQNLQLAMDEKCSLYEFVPEVGKGVEGYVMKLSDGRLVVIDGGSKENGSRFYDFIAQYGNVIDTWYVYENNEESAYDYCIEKTDLIINNSKTIGLEESK